MPTSTDPATRLLSEQALDACEVAQLLPDALDLRCPLLTVLAQGGELRTARLVVGEQLLGERAAADLAEDVAQPCLHRVVDDARPAREVAVFGDVGDRVAHVLVAALIEQVDDELQLVQALVVGDLRLVARLDEHVEARLHERGNAAAQHGLLAEEIALRLLRERRLEQADACAADADAIRKREVERAPARVGLHRDETGCARPGDVQLAHAMTGRLRRDHDHVVPLRRSDAAEVDVQPVREQHGRAVVEVRRHLLVPHLLLHVVGEEQRHDLRTANRVRNGANLEAGVLGGRLRAAAVAQSDDDVDAGVAQVERMRMPLAAVADDGDLAGEEIEVALAIDGCHAVLLSGQHVLARTFAVGTVRTAEADAPGAHELLQPMRTDELLEGVAVFRRAGELEDDGVGTEVDDTRVEDLAERHQLGALARRRRHLHEDELALDGLAGNELCDAEDVHELVHLLFDLLERARLAVDADGDARDVVLRRRPDGEALDVEAAAREQARDAHEHGRLVLHEDGQGVPHVVTSATVSRNSTRSSAAAPAGIIGKQCSRGSTRASTTAVRPHAIASASAPSRSSSLSTVKPSAPYARASAA